MTPAQGRKPVALVALIGGGFTFETKCLLASLQAEVDFVYLRTEFGGIPGEGGLPTGESQMIPSFASKTRGSLATSAVGFVGTLAATIGLLRRRAVDVVIGVGSSHAVPMLLAARLTRRRTIFLESVTRVDRLSATGRMVYFSRLADVFIVQWPSLHAEYPASRLGTIL